MTRAEAYRHEIARDAALRAAKNCEGVAPLAVPQLLYAPIWSALTDADVKPPRNWTPTPQE